MKLHVKHSLLIAALAVGSTTVLGACGESGGNVDRPKYTISFYSNGGTAVESVKYYAGDAISAPTAPTRPNYSFLGWYETYHEKLSDFKDDTIYTFSTMPAKNFTLYAGWAKEGGGSATDEQVKKYMADLKENSEADHLYYHYYRFGNVAATYSDWDVWAWPYKPDSGEGTRIDWVGRTTSQDRLSATGTATIDDIGGAVADIDLKATYPAGWDAADKKMLNTPMTFEDSTHVGLQIVKSETRLSDSGFWVNDGSNVYIRLSDYAMELDNGGTAYHVFVLQDKVYQPQELPITSTVDPFDDDDGTNVTYGDSTYDNIDWNAPIGQAKTASAFSSTGVGYQIMVSSFADSDGDGFGDIYGIVEKLPYLHDLGVKALWLTPIQLSDSYHGYDITDYEKVDPKFGSLVSPAGLEAGEVTTETAMEDYKLLIAEANKLGMKIVMDLVLNHTSTANNWFTSSANLDDDYRGYYQWGNHVTNPNNINENKYWYPYGDHVYSYYAKFGSAMPELNYSFKSTREAVEEMSAFWAKDIGVDGFRLDAVKHIYMLDEISSYAGDTVIYDETTVGGRNVSYSSDLTKNLNFFKELKVEVSKKAGRDIFFVGENFDGHAYHVAPYYEAFDSMFDFYAYFNLTSGAATGRTGTTSGYGTVGGWMNNPAGVFTPGQKSGGSGDNGGKDFDLAKNGIWDFPHVYEVYNKYRKAGGGSDQVSLPGAFTSNHDIARVVNRIAGTGNSQGLNAQGNLTTSNYASFEVSANLVKIAEVMLPGLTWVYYGDEIGMTGNFPKGKDAQSDYADLWYRQPMKWVQDGEKGDEYGTTDYYVTGSNMKVEQDEVNKSTAVKGAFAQQQDPNSDFNVLKKFITIKNGDENLVKGNITYGNWVWGTCASNVLAFGRNNDQYRVLVNFNRDPVSVNNDGPLSGYQLIASYNYGGSGIPSELPGYSAFVFKK